MPSTKTSRSELLTIDQAISRLKTTRPTFYRWLKSGQIKGMKVGRQWRFYPDDLDRFLAGKDPRVESPGDLAGFLRALDGLLQQAGASHPPIEPDGEPSAAIARILRLTLAMRASDVHLQPSKEHALLRFRIDGALHEIAQFDSRVLEPVVSRFKSMAACDVKEKSRPQDGWIITEIDGHTLNIRACFVPALQGESATFLLLQSGNFVFDVARLGFHDTDRQRLERAMRNPWGLVLITGPTGAGKTTVLYSALQLRNTPDTKIMTVEDPVEYELPGIVQVNLKPAAGATLPTVLRSFLRSDPDVVMAGEIRDRETVQILLTLALIGKLTLSTLHTDDAAGAVVRLIELGVEPAMVANALRLVLAQRLVRRLCPKCSVEAPLDENLSQIAKNIAREGGETWPIPAARFRKAVGCKDCSMTGYRGRVPIVETLEMSTELAGALRNSATAADIRRVAVRNGMTTMAADGLRRAAAGETTLEEVLRVIPRE